MVCEEDTYFRELVRYIYLNPLRAKLVDSLGRLQRYKWCGHAVVLGRRMGLSTSAVGQILRRNK